MYPRSPRYAYFAACTKLLTSATESTWGTTTAAAPASKIRAMFPGSLFGARTIGDTPVYIHARISCATVCRSCVECFILINIPRILAIFNNITILFFNTSLIDIIVYTSPGRIRVRNGLETIKVLSCQIIVTLKRGDLSPYYNLY